MPSDTANFAFVSGASTLAAKYATSYRRSAPPLDPSDLHSAVHPPVNAFGNHATTTADRPVKSDSRYVRPSDPTSAKSGAGSPGASSTDERSACVTALKMPTARALTVAASRRSIESCHSSKGHTANAGLPLQLFSTACRYSKSADRRRHRLESSD